jgi:hypothetical protein
MLNVLRVEIAMDWHFKILSFDTPFLDHCLPTIRGKAANGQA